MLNKEVSLTKPLMFTDLQAQQQSVERQRKMAEYLQKQSAGPMDEGKMVSGWYVAPSRAAHINKLAQTLLGAYAGSQADQQESDLTKRSNQQLIDGLQNYQTTLQGTPAHTIVQDPQEVAQAFDTEGMAVPQNVNAPAQPGNRQAALAELLRSGHPTLQQLGVAEMLKKPEAVFNKVDAKDFTQESVAKFASTQNYADLVPVRKMEVGPAGQVYNPFSVQPGTILNDPNKPFSLGPTGPVANTGFQNYEIEKAKKGATNVQVKTDVKTGESLAAQVGPMMKDSTSIAEGAVKQVDAAQRVVKAIDSGNVITGPGATLRLKGAQISQMLGIGGKDEAEKIANTRGTIRGFAELTLQGRQQMKGQGAITESEGKLAEKAMSGDIDDLTPAEIKQLAKASERTARFNHTEHTRKLKVMQDNPALQGIAPFYQGPAMPAEFAAPAPNQPTQPGTVLRFDAQGNPIK